MWTLQALEIREGDERTGRWRLTATSDADGGGPFGDMSHSHGSAKEAMECEACDEFCSKITGFMSKKRVAEALEKKDRAEYERLKEKYG